MQRGSPGWPPDRRPNTPRAPGGGTWMGRSCRDFVGPAQPDPQLQSLPPSL